jgi:hypothetical protein
VRERDCVCWEKFIFEVFWTVQFLTHSLIYPTPTHLLTLVTSCLDATLSLSCRNCTLVGINVRFSPDPHLPPRTITMWSTRGLIFTALVAVSTAHSHSHVVDRRALPDEVERCVQDDEPSDVDIQHVRAPPPPPHHRAESQRNPGRSLPPSSPSRSRLGPVRPPAHVATARSLDFLTAHPALHTMSRIESASTAVTLRCIQPIQPPPTTHHSLVLPFPLTPTHLLHHSCMTTPEIGTDQPPPSECRRLRNLEQRFKLGRPTSRSW